MTRRRIACFTPLPPLHTGIADYNAAMLPALAERFETEVYASPRNVSAVSVSLPCGLYAAPDFEVRRRSHPYDAVIYHIGNSPYHSFAYEMLLRYPGITVLHELVLHHFFLERTLEFKDTAGYLREMGYNAGPAGVLWARQAMQGHVPYPRYAQPLYGRVVDASRLLVVHSRYMAQQIRETHPDALTMLAPLGCDPSAQTANPALTTELRQRWHIPAGAFVVATFGRLDHQKRVQVLCDAVRRLRPTQPQAFALLVGEAVPGFDLAAALGTLPAEGCAFATGYVSQAEFYAAFDLAHVVVNLRFPTAGETSAAIVQMLGRGLPLITSDIDSFAEWPDDVAIKIPLVADETERLRTALDVLASQPGLRRAMSDSARQLISRAHTPQRVADAYAGAVEVAIGQERRVWRKQFQSRLARQEGDPHESA